MRLGADRCNYNLRAHMLGIAIPNPEFKDLRLEQFEVLEELCKSFRKKEALVQVLKVRERNTGQLYCLKKMQATHEADLKMFANELRVLYGLHHPHIVTLLGHFEEGDHVYALYELAEKTLNKESKTMSTQEIASVLAQLCEALEYLHAQKLIHRDVNIKNVLLNKKAQGWQVKLIDFEFAAPMSLQRRTQLGTLASLAPEVVSEATQNDKVDAWGVGIILFNLMVRAQPFLVKGEDVYERTIDNIKNLRFALPADLDEDARDLLGRVLVGDPAQRMSVRQIREHPFLRKHTEIPTQPQPKEGGGEDPYRRELQDKVSQLQQSLAARKQDRAKPKELDDLERKLNTLEEQFRKAQEENDSLKYRLKESELSCLKLEKEKRAMDEHKINLEKSKLQHSKILSNVQRVTEENAKIQARLAELEKELDRVKSEEARVADSAHTDRQRHVYVKRSPSQNRVLSKDKKSATPLAGRAEDKKDQSRSVNKFN